MKQDILCYADLWRELGKSNSRCPICHGGHSKGRLERLEGSLRELGYRETHAHPLCVIAARKKLQAYKLARGLK